MQRKAGKLPWKRIALWGFVLNAGWEFGHAGPFYDMWEEVGLGDGMFHIWLAILGDVVIVFGVALIACQCVGRPNVLSMSWRGCLALLGVGLIAAIGLEWTAKMLDWWTYNNRMPTLTVFDETVGLSPVAQVTLLPALSVYLAACSLHETPSHSRE